MRKFILQNLFALLLVGLPIPVLAQQQSTSDLILLELRGPVKKCVEKDGDNSAIIYTFDRNGKLLKAVTEDGYQLYANIKRDSKGRIIEYGDNEPNEMDGEVYKSAVTWTNPADGKWRVKTLSEPNPEGDVNSNYTYHTDKTWIVSKKVVLATGMNYSGTVTYSNYVFDAYQNWTKRTASHNLVCKMDNDAPLRYTEKQVRTITYWELPSTQQSSSSTLKPSSNDLQSNATSKEPSGNDKKPTPSTEQPTPPAEQPTVPEQPTPTPGQTIPDNSQPTPTPDQVPVPTPRPQPKSTPGGLIEESAGKTMGIIEICDYVVALNNTATIQEVLEKSYGFVFEKELLGSGMEGKSTRFPDMSVIIKPVKKKTTDLKYLELKVRNNDSFSFDNELKKCGYKYDFNLKDPLSQMFKTHRKAKPSYFTYQNNIIHTCEFYFIAE